MRVRGYLLVLILGLAFILIGALPALAVEPVNIAVSTVTSSTATLVVKTDVPSNVIVDYGFAPGQYTSSVASNGLVRHEAALSGLSAGSTVYYQVSIANSADAADILVLPEKNFQTARPPGQPFSFGVAGDNRPPPLSPIIQPLVWGTIVGQMTGENLDFLLHDGDLVMAATADSAAQNEEKYDALFYVTQSLASSTPIYTAVGNHELISDPENRAGYEEEFTLPVNNGPDAATDGEEYYSFDSGDTHFIVLCTEIPGKEGLVTAGQFTWLQQDLAGASKPWTVVIMHRPLFSGTHVTEPWQDPTKTWGQANKEALVSLFQQYGVDLVFAGHDHFYLHHADNGIHYITSGGGGAPLYNLPTFGPGDVFGAKANHHVKVDETPGSLSVTAIDDSGNTLESFTLGALNLGIHNTAIYWSSYYDYLAGLLAVDYSLSNSGPGDAGSLNVVYLTASNGVTPSTGLPLELGALKAGQSVPLTIKYLVPAGVGFFRSTTFITGTDLAGAVYALPEPVPAL